jgi:two-component system, LuxR family, response regulator FixJ
LRGSKSPLRGADEQGSPRLSTVFVVDDDPAVRALVRGAAISVHLEVECYARGTDFLRAYDGTRPGCLVLDVRMPVMSGLDLQAELAARGIEIPIIVVTGYADVSMAVQALRAGAMDFIEKPFGSQTILERVQEAVALDRQKRQVIERFADFSGRLRRLTQREREVLALLVEGRANKQIAEQLALSRKTVETHRANVMSKTGAESLAELIRLGLQASGALPLRR